MKKISFFLVIAMALMCVGCGCSGTEEIDTEATKAETTKTETTMTETTKAETETKTEKKTEEETTTEEITEPVTEAQTEPETEAPTEPETEAPTEPEDPKLAYLNRVTDTSQMIMIIGTGEASNATMYFYEKDGDTWNCKRQCDAYVGQNGFSNSTYEGDRTTPTGVFNVGVAFGIKPNPGTALDWFDVTDADVWVDDINSQYYNQHIDKYEIPDGWESGEHLIDFTEAYAYAFNIEVNPPYQTSAIFFHCFSPNPYTGGCVAVSEDDCAWVLQNIRKDAKITIVASEEELTGIAE